jgi:multiple sugar transport system ATP-binding protein
MAFALKMRKVAEAQIDRRIKQTAELLGIGHLLKRKPKALSGGQRQRVALGRAIVRNPRAFLFDEPLSNLDAALRLAMRAELKDLHRRLQTTTVYVTHDQAEAMSLAERICVMRDGAVQQTADPLEVHDRPVNRFVAGFFGTPPMNFFEGQIRSHNDGLCFDFGHETIGLPQHLQTVLRRHCGKAMILGVRPENISASDRAGKVENSISATVGVVEPLGVRTDLYMTNRDGQRFIASVDPHTRLAAGDAVRIHIDIERVHIFEPEEAGRNIAISGSVD